MTLEQMICEMVKNGMSTEDVARETQDVLNSIEKVEKEKREKKKAMEIERKNYLRGLERDLRADFEKGRYTLSDVGKLATLVVARDYPNWRVCDIDVFMDCVIKNVTTQAELVLDEDEGWRRIFSAINDILKPCGGCKQEKKKKQTYDFDSPDENFLDCLIDTMNEWIK